MLDKIISNLENLPVDDKVIVVSAAIGISTFLLSSFPGTPKWWLRVWSILIVFGFSWLGLLQHRQRQVELVDAARKERQADSVIAVLKNQIEESRAEGDNRHNEVTMTLEEISTFERLSQMRTNEICFNVTVPPATSKRSFDQKVFGNLFKIHKKAKVDFVFSTIIGNVNYSFSPTAVPDSAFILTERRVDYNLITDSALEVDFRNDICKRDNDLMTFSYSVRDSLKRHEINAGELYRFLLAKSIMFKMEVKGLNGNLKEADYEALATRLSERFSDSYLSFQVDKLMGISVFASCKVDWLVIDNTIELYFYVEEAEILDQNSYDGC
jgi:hypothetical protein